MEYVTRTKFKLMNAVVFTLSITAVLFGSSTNAQCSGVWVSNAVKETSINGYYNLVGQYSCSGQNVWVQDTGNSNQCVNYLYWFSPKYGSAYSTSNSWFIGKHRCTNSSVYAKNTVPSGTSPSYPYITSTPWQEYYNYGYYQNNERLTVTCSSGLSYWVIIAITFGCVIATLLIVGIIVCACSHNEKAKRKVAASELPSAPRAPVYTVGNFDLSPRYTPTADPPTADLNSPSGNSVPTVTGPEPPSYDSIPPPSYDNTGYV